MTTIQYEPYRLFLSQGNIAIAELAAWYGVSVSFIRKLVEAPK